jgi:hypothetical protein
LTVTLGSSEDTHIFSDIEGRHVHTLGGGTIPPDILPTNEKPDIVIVQPTHITIIELSVPFESNIKIRHKFKCNKYAMLISDLRRCGLEVTLHALEIGSHVYISPENKDTLQAIFYYMSSKELKMLHHELTKQALVSRFVVFFSKYSKLRMGDIRYVVNTT